MSDVFRRDLDRIEVPADAIWVPARRRRSPISSFLAVAGAGALVIAAVTGGLALRRDGDVTAPTLPSASPGASRTPGSIHQTANVAAWATGHVPTGTILMLLGRTGLDARLSPPAPAKALLFNASDLELVAVDDSTVRGFVIYRYRDAVAASTAYQLPLIHDPNAGTISWVARPRFVLIGDALVNYGTDDDATHERIARALVYPDLATVPPASCAEQRERTLGMSAIILRHDRAAAKRMTVADLEAGGLRVGPRETDPNTFVCVVAVAGELRQPTGVLAVPNYSWGVFVSGAGGEPIGTTVMDNRGSWPPFFDALPDRAPNPYPATVTELVDSTTVRVTLDSAMLSREFGTPALFRADRYTELVPSARDIGAMGVQVGDRVIVFFQRERRDAGSGAYLLSKLAVVPSPAPPTGDAFDVFIGGHDGAVHVVRDLQLHRSITACAPPTSAVSVIGALDDRSLLVRCSSVVQPGGNPTRTPLPRVPDVWLTLRVDTGSVAHLASLSRLQPESVALSPARDQIALRMVDCVASRCSFTIALATLATGQVRTILEPSEGVTSLRWTALGISVYLLAPHERGTYLHEGAAWRKLSYRHLLHADAAGRMLMEETVPAVLGRSGGILWERTATGERALTDGQQTAYGVALFEPDGSVVVTILDGSYVTEYRGGRIARSVKGEFCATAERFRDWFVCMPSTTAADRVAMYSVATGEHRVASVMLPQRAHGTAIALLPRTSP